MFENCLRIVNSLRKQKIGQRLKSRCPLNGFDLFNALDQRNQAQEQDDTYAVLALSVSFCTVNVKAKDQSCKAFWLNNPGLFIGACATAPCMLYTLYKPFTCYLLFCPVGVNGRRHTLPERS